MFAISMTTCSIRRDLLHMALSQYPSSGQLDAQVLGGMMTKAMQTSLLGCLRHAFL